MRQLIIPLCIVFSAGACLAWAQAPANPQKRSVPAPQIKLVRSVIPSYPVDAGKEMFNTYCGTCHGEDGRGFGPAAPALTMNVPDLTLLSARNGGNYPKYRVLTALSRQSEFHGQSASDMPDWYPAFASLDRTCPLRSVLRARNISRYVETLQAKK